MLKEYWLKRPKVSRICMELTYLGKLVFSILNFWVKNWPTESGWPNYSWLNFEEAVKQLIYQDTLILFPKVSYSSSYKADSNSYSI